MAEILILLLAAHCFGDFILQTGWMADGKSRGRWGALVSHCGLHGLAAYVVLQDWTGWQLPVALLAVHCLIDWVKSRFSASPAAFAVDQLVHVLSLAALAALAGPFGWTVVGEVVARDWIVAVAGFSAAVFGTGYFIGAVAGKMIAENPGLEEALGRGLKNGGVQIGRLERALIFVLMAAGQPQGIGFLIAAKSILRFEEAKKQDLAEYVLIGTLWSFGLGIALSWLTLEAIRP